MKSVNIQSGDKKIAAVVHEGSENKLAVFMPGFLDSKDYPDLVTLAEVVNELGLTAVRFDPIGTWDSEGDEHDYCATEYLHNLRSVIDYMEAENQQPFDCIVVGGKSLGGFISTVYASADERISAVVSIVAPTSLKRDRGISWETDGVRYSTRDLPGDPSQTRAFSVPWAHALDAEQYDVVAAVKKLHIPILFVAGEKDDKIPPEKVQALYEQANEPKQFIVVPDATHDYRFNEAHLKQIKDITKDFVSTHLK